MPASNIAEKIVLVNGTIEPRYQAKAAEEPKTRYSLPTVVIFAAFN